MADIAPINEANLNFGLQQSQQAQATASTSLLQQQAQGAAIQNQRAAQMLALYRQGLSHVMDFAGQNNQQDRSLPDISSSSSASGVSAVAASKYNADQSQQSQSAASGGATPVDDIGQSAADQGRIESYIESTYNVNPEGTPQEQARIHQAFAQSMDPTIAAVPELKAWADAQLAGAKGDRDMAVKSRLNASRLNASQSYDLIASVEDAPDGQAFEMLSKMPGGSSAASRIRQASPDASPEELDEITRDTAAHTAGFMFRFTGRPSEYGTDGYLYDKDSGLKVAGAPPRGFSQQQIADMRKEGLAMTTMTIDGKDTSVHQYQASGFENVDQYVQQGVAQAQAVQRGENHIQSVAAHAAIHLNSLPGNQPGMQPGQPPQQGGAQQPQPASGTSGQPRVLPGSPWGAGPASPNATATGGRLDFTDAPPSPLPNMRGSNSKPSADQVAIQTEYGKGLAESASTASQKVGAANAAIQGANNAQIALANGAMTGPASSKAAYLQTLLGNPAILRGMLGDAGAHQILAKALGNDALMDLEHEATAGGAQMRLGQNTMNMAINKLAASPEMTPAAIKTMTDAVKANAVYDKQKWGADFAAYNRTAGPSVDRRADAYDLWYNTKYPNTSTINPQTLSGASPSMPSASANKGRAITLKSGQKLQSNGQQWLPVKVGG